MQNNLVLVTPDKTPVNGLKTEEHSSIKKPQFVTTGQELMNLQIHDIPTLLDPLIPQTGMICLAGSSDTGKSSWLRALAMAITTKEPTFLNFKLNPRHHSAIYLSSEDDETAISFLLSKQNAGKYSSSTFADLRFIFDTENLLRKLDEELTRKPADAVFLDCFSDLYGNDMNSSNQVRTFLNQFSNLAKKHDTLITWLHHCSKRSEEAPPSKNNLLGSVGFEGKCRLVLELRRDNFDPAIRHMNCVKGNYLSGIYKESSFVLRFTDQLTFENTGERVPFYQLGKTEHAAKNKNKHTAAKQRAIELKEQGMSVRDNTEQLNSEGYKVGKSTVGEWLKDCPSVPETLTEMENGQAG
jgi:hypothetical protein